ELGGLGEEADAALEGEALVELVEGDEARVEGEALDVAEVVGAAAEHDAQRVQVEGELREERGAHHDAVDGEGEGVVEVRRGGAAALPLCRRRAAVDDVEGREAGVGADDELDLLVQGEVPLAPHG